MSEEEGVSRRGFLAGLFGAAATLAFPGIASARSWLRIQYVTYKKELALKVPVLQGVSYNFMAELYTGSENNGPALQFFNNNKQLIYNKNNPTFIFIPQRLLTSGIKRIFDENKFSTFEIDQQGDDQAINTLWDVAQDFMNDSLSVQEKIDILLILNDDVNPIKKIVYPGQRLIVPDSLIERNLIVEEDEKPQKILSKEPEPKLQKEKPKEGTKGKTLLKQNPFRLEVSIVLKALRKRDLFGARRIRGGKGKYRISKHTGIDLVAAIGTILYPIEKGKILYAGKDVKKFWRNGNVVQYQTNSGLVVKYCHLSQILVKAGQDITLTTALGKVGISGNANKKNPHVHIGMRKNGKVVDPKLYVVL